MNWKVRRVKVRRVVGDFVEGVLNVVRVLLLATAFVVAAFLILFFGWWAAAELGVKIDMPSAGDRKAICVDPPSDSYWMVYEDRTRSSGWSFMGVMNAEEEAIHCPQFSQ